LDRLTEPQKVIYYNQSLEREINNGGLSQYFFNSSGDFSHETVKSLKVIGADKTADILQAAINIFPDKEIPKNRIEKQDLLEKIERIASENWEELDQQFFRYEEDLNILNMEYIRKNKENF
jgi:hypothetical protein